MRWWWKRRKPRGETVRVVSTSSDMSSVALDEYELPIPMADLERIAANLRELDVFCPGPTAGDIYDWLSCRKAHADGVTIAAILDRNILKDVIELARSARSDFEGPMVDRARFGAAVMAYALCSNILIDPGLTVHEQPVSAADDLSLFRQADEADAAMYAEVALGRAQRLKHNSLPSVQMDRAPRPAWGSVRGNDAYRLAVLKIAVLELAPLNGYARIEQFVEWSSANYIFLPAALNLAVHQFRSQRSNPVLRRVASPDRARALRAVDNAVWDLIVASDWAERVTRQLHEKKFWILCSRDEGLKALARNLHFSQEAGQTRESALQRIFVEAWGTPRGGHLTARLMELMIDQENPARWCNQPEFELRIASMTRELEQEFLAWQPS